MQNLITVFSNQYAYAYDGVDCHEYIRGAPRIHVSFYVNSGIYCREYMLYVGLHFLGAYGLDVHQQASPKF